MLRVFIIEPVPSLAPLLKNHNDVLIVGSARGTADGSDQTHAADLILLSAHLPLSEILDFLEQARPETRVVITDADETENALVSLLEAGAAGYVHQGASADRIVTTLHTIHSGELPLAPPVGTALVERMLELLALQQQRTDVALIENCPDLTTLTAREREILGLLRGGASNQDIAGQLTIQLGTVKNHVHSILKKLNVSRRQQAAVYADLVK